MKARIYILLLAVSLCSGFSFGINAQEAGWDLAKSGGGRNNDLGLAVHRHSPSIIYAGGKYTGTTQFGLITVPGSGADDGIVLRYTANGDVVWANRITSTGNDRVLAITSDANGNVFASGYFESTANINGTFVQSKGGKDIFLAKYSQAGLLLWVKTIGSIGDDMGTGVSCDATGNVYVTGTYSDSLRLILNSNDTVKLGTAGGKDIILAKFDENGAFLTYARGGGSQDDISADIQVHSSGIAFTGTYSGKIRFKNDSLISNGANDMFFVNYSLNAFEPVWLRSIGGTGDDSGDDISTDGSGNLYISGSASGTISVGSINLTSAGGTDGLIAKYLPNGTPEWAQLIGSKLDDNCSGISAESSGNIVVTGVFSDTCAIGSKTLISKGGKDVYVARLTTAGNVSWVQSAGSTSDDNVEAISHNAAGGAYVVGNHGFESHFSKITLTGKGGSDFFMARILNIGTHDVGVTAINTPAVPFASGNQTLSVTIKNFGTATVNNVKLEVYKAGIKIDSTLQYSTPLNPGESAIVTLNPTFIPPSVLTEFLVATLKPNGNPDENNGNDIEIRKIGPALSKGTYTIGGLNPTFTSVGKAADYISNWGILDSIVFHVRSGSYSDMQVEMNAIPGSSISKPVTFKKDPSASTKPLISFESLYAERNYVMQLQGADNMSFHDLSFIVSSNVLGNAVILKNNTDNITFNAIDFEIPASASGNGLSIESTNAANNLSIAHSNFIGGTYSIASTYDTSSATAVNATIYHNTFSGFKEGGVTLTNTAIATVANNTFMPANSASKGITLIKNTGGATISDNSIVGLKQGIALGLYKVIGSSNAKNTISNTMATIGSPTTIAHGITLVHSDFVQVLHNTIHGFNADYDGTMLTAFGGNNHDFINNVLYNSGRGTGINITYNAMTGNPNIYSNNNLIYTDSGRVGTINDGITTVHSSTLANWKNNSQKDANSISKAVQFSQDNLHLQEADPALFGDVNVKSIVIKDIDAEPRKNSYIGADEIIPVITILEQPKRTLVCDTSAAYLYIKADATFNGTLSYQWTKDNVIMPGETNDTLFFNRTTYNNEGFYRCIVKCNSGADTVLSDNAQLLISTQTIILNDVQNQYVVTGGTAIFDVGAEAGNMPPTHLAKYRWFRDSVEFTTNTDQITGVNTPRLILRNVQPADTGRRYRVIVEGACGSDTSSTVGIYMPGVLFTKQPTDTTVCKFSNIKLKAEVTPTMSGLQLGYQWKKNFVNIVDDGRISGANTPELTINNVTAADTSSNYTLEVLVVANNARFFSNQVKVLNYVTTEITKQPKTEQACLNKPYTMNVEALGSNLTYQWQRNDTNIIGATGSAYTVPVWTEEKEGNYRVIVSGVCGTSVSTVARVKSYPKLTVMNQTDKKYIKNIGQDISLFVNASGVDPIRYQWYHNGVKDDANTQMNFSRKNAASKDAGYYLCVITDICDTVVSDTIFVRLDPVGVEEQEPYISNGTFTFGTLHPIPATDYINAPFMLSAPSNVTIHILDIMGREVVQAYSAQLDAGQYSIPMNVSELSTGTYTCTITAHGSTYSQRLLIRR